MTDEPPKQGTRLPNSATKPGYSRGRAIPLLRNRNRIVQLLPGFVTRSSGKREVSVALQELDPDGTTTPRKEIKLDERGTRTLAEALSNLEVVASKQDPGEYIYAPTPKDASKLFANIGDLLQDPTAAKVLFESAGSEKIVSAVKYHIRTSGIREATDELLSLLNSGKTQERHYQKWCVRHTWAFGNAYVARDEIQQIASGATVDILLENLVGYRDIVELKRPDMLVIRNFRDRLHCFSKDCTEAIGQCHSYLDILHEDARKGLRRSPGTVAYHPHATIVIGRSKDWDESEHEALQGLNSRLHGITIMTYDYLLTQCEVLCRHVGI